MTKLLKVRITNILGLASADLDLGGKSVVIGGPNGVGKTSLQRALKMALGGATLIPEEPTHNGAEKGEVFVTLDNGYRVRFSVTKDRKVKLVISHADNPDFKATSVTLLKKLFGDLSFDPGDAMARGAKGLAESLMRIAKLDFAALDAERAANFNRRTDIGRDETRLAGQLSGLTFHKDAPEQEETAGPILAEIEAAQKLITEQTVRGNAIRTHVANSQKLTNDLAEIDAQMERLQANRKKVEAARDIEADAAETLAADAAAFVVPDPEPLRQRLSGIEEANRKVRENQQHARVKAERDAASAEYSRLTGEIDRIDAEKRRMLAEAKLPIEGVTFEESGVRFNGRLLDAWSESERWEIATAVAFAENEESIVFVSQSGGMDKRTRAKVIERARSLGVQALLEVVDDAEDVQILIENGEVVENRLVTAGGPAA